MTNVLKNTTKKHRNECSHTQVRRNGDREWSVRNPGKAELLTWEEFRENTYSFLHSTGMASTRLKDMEARDRRRWQLADANKDDKLDRDEFSGFLHPETEQRMGEIVVTELMEDMDSDRTGLEKTINIKQNKATLLLWLGKDS